MANGRPYGNDFLVHTPHLDQLNQRLYAEQKQRELLRQRDLQDLDNEFSRNVAQIKDADVNDLTKLYGDYKTASQQLMKQKGGATPQQQLELLRKKAEMYKLINVSRQEKENAALLGKAIRTDSKGIYDPSAPTRLKARLNTPTLQYGDYTELGPDGKPVPVDLTDDTAYLYKLGASDFSKDFEAAAGKERDLTPDDPIPDPNDKFKTIQKTYKGKNNPIEFYNTLLPRVAGSKEQRDFVLRTQLEFPPEKAAALEQQFNELMKDPSYRKRYGLKDGDNLPLSAYDSDVAKAVRLRAMQHAVDTRFTEGKPIVSSSDEKKMADRQAFALKMENIKHSHILARSKMNQEKPGLANYDIFPKYDSKIKTKTVKSGSNFLGNKEEKVIAIIPANEVDIKDKKLIGDVSPVVDDDGSKYYIVRDDGDWEGKNGQVISRANAARSNMDQTSVNEVGRGRLNPDIVPNKPQTRLPKDIKNTRMVPNKKVTDPELLKKLNGH